MVSDFPVLNPASWVGIFWGAFFFASLFSILLCHWLSMVLVGGFLLPGLRLLLSIVFQGIWLVVLLRPLLLCALLASFINLSSYGLGLVVQWWLRILLGCLSRCHLCSGMASESLNKARFILTQRHGGQICWSKTASSAVNTRPHGTTIRIWSQYNINFMSFGLPQMQRFNIISDRTDFEEH